MGKLDIRGYQDCPPYSSRVFLCSKLIWVAFLGHRICFPDGLSLTKSFYSVEKRKSWYITRSSSYIHSSTPHIDKYCSSQPSRVHWLSSSIFPFCLFGRCPAMVTSFQISLLVAPHPQTHTFSDSF